MTSICHGAVSFLSSLLLAEVFPYLLFVCSLCFLCIHLLCSDSTWSPTKIFPMGTIKCIVSCHMTLYCIASCRMALYRVMGHCVVAHCVVWHCTVSHRIVSCGVSLYYVVSLCIILYCAVSYRNVLCRIVSHCVVSLCIILYCVVSYRIVACRIVSYCIVLYCFVSYCIVPYRVVSCRMTCYWGAIRLWDFYIYIIARSVFSVKSSAATSCRWMYFSSPTFESTRPGWRWHPLISLAEASQSVWGRSADRSWHTLQKRGRYPRPLRGCDAARGNKWCQYQREGLFPPPLCSGLVLGLPYLCRGPAVGPLSPPQWRGECWFEISSTLISLGTVRNLKQL